MWAMMPMLRVRASDVSLGISFQLTALSDQLSRLRSRTNSFRRQLTADG
jgi:hypothetical protein